MTYGNFYSILESRGGGSVKDLGSQIRELRKRRGWTLQRLSERSGLSVSFLSQVERGLSSLSISSLSAVAEALGVPLSEFFTITLKPSVVIRSQDHGRFRIEGSPITYCALSGPLKNKALEPLLVEVPPHYDGTPPFAHRGEEFAYVLEGSITLTIQGRDYRLEPGDSIHFTSEVPHTYRNEGAEPAKVIWVLTPRLLEGGELSDGQEAGDRHRGYIH